MPTASARRSGGRMSAPCTALIGLSETQTRSAVILELKSSPQGFVIRFEEVVTAIGAETFRGVFIFVEQSGTRAAQGK